MGREAVRWIAALLVVLLASAELIEEEDHDQDYRRHYDERRYERTLWEVDPSPPVFRL